MQESIPRRKTDQRQHLCNQNDNGHAKTDQATTADQAFPHRVCVYHKREPQKRRRSYSGNFPTVDEFELAIQNMHVVACTRNKKNSKHTSQNTHINLLLRGLLRGRSIVCALTHHFNCRLFLLPAEVSLTKWLPFRIDG